MKISYNWLKQYIKPLPDPEELSEILTGIGLEVEGMEPLDSIKGGLEGLVIGEVKTCEKHPNADKLSMTTVNVGGPEMLHIVCGAPNVAAGQKVVVATIGTTLYSGAESFVIKKTKIRGELSEGMICAEDEIGLGDSHEGIMVLEPNARVGLAAKQYFNLQEDYIFEIGLTPNRIDAGSHFGVARDLAAYFSQKEQVILSKPSIDRFKVQNQNLTIPIEIENSDACPRYCGVTLSGVTVETSPEWLQQRLRAIGMKPINNVVDATNFVLHEIGQPLHAFDADKIKGNKITVKNLPDKTSLVLLDEVERKLTAGDLVICNAEEGMALAGVFGGFDSGVDANTTRIFIESAYFNPVTVRKTARYHGLNTDASFHFERGADPNITLWALKRAAILIQEIAGGEISSEVQDNYPRKIKPLEVEVRYSGIDRLIGKKLPHELVKTILKGLEIEVTEEKGDLLTLNVPSYRVDVTREADVVEEILRIYGYNNVEFSEQLASTLSYEEKPTPERVTEVISEFLSSRGFAEIMSNSLTQAAYYNGNPIYSLESAVKMLNPLSNDLNVLRQTLLYNGLETIIYNTNRQSTDLKLYEFGNIYRLNVQVHEQDPLRKYYEEKRLALFLTGNEFESNWMVKDQLSGFYHLKAHVENILERLGILSEMPEGVEFSNEIFAEGLEIRKDNKTIVQYGRISSKTLHRFDIKNEVYFAEFNWTALQPMLRAKKIQYVELPKFPEVRRDLSLLLNKEVEYSKIKEISNKAERKILKKVFLFDVYTGDRIEQGKKSYAVGYILQDPLKTLNDHQIEQVMNKISTSLERELGAQVRQ